MMLGGFHKFVSPKKKPGQPNKQAVADKFLGKGNRSARNEKNPSPANFLTGGYLAWGCSFQGPVELQ